MTEPIIQERLEAFWKRWGFSQLESDGELFWWADWYTEKDLPALTLDNLFKYAVPAAKIKEVELGNFETDGVTCEVWSGIGGLTATSARADTPALALFLALEKLPQVGGNRETVCPQGGTK